MLKIKARRSDRERVQEIAAEYISSKFHELKGDYELLIIRLDIVEAGLKKIENLPDKMNQTVDQQVKEMKDLAAEMQKQVRETIEALDLDQVGALEHRVEYLEERIT